MPCFGGMDMGAISVELVDKWLANFDTAGAARKAWSVLRAILRRAIRWNLLDVDITRRDIQLPAKPHYEPRILSIRQQRALLRGFTVICLRRGLSAPSHAGSAPKKATGSNGRISICAQASCTWSVACNGSPGMRPSYRRKPNCPAAHCRCRASRSNDCASSGHARGGRLIGTLTPPQAARQYKAYCKRHDLPHVPARNLRHSWATNTLAAGADIAIVSKMLGHSDIKTTAKYYLKPDITALRDAQRLWERALVA